MDRELTFRIVLEKPPAGVDFGLQKGKGNAYETIQKQRSGTSDLHFEFPVRVSAGAKGAGPNLLGPFVQGPPAVRFVYIDIGACAGQAGTSLSRRLKVPLTGITPDILEQASNNPKLVLEARVPGTGKDGTPTCATVKPFSGWKLVQPQRK
jgi:hypothetical protein